MHLLIKLEAIKKLIDKKMNVNTDIITDYLDDLRVYKIINPQTQESYCTLFADVEIIYKDGKRYLSLDGIINGVVSINNQTLTPNEIQFLVNNNNNEGVL